MLLICIEFVFFVRLMFLSILNKSFNCFVNTMFLRDYNDNKSNE